MIYNYIKNFAFVLLAGTAITANAQTTLYSEDFNSGTPAGFTSSAEWLIDNSVIPVSTGYPGASGGNHYAASNGSTVLETLTFDNNFSTIASTSITVQWGGYKDPSFPGLTFEWSSDGVTWNSQAFTDVPATSTWGQTNVIALPAGAAGVSNLRLRWSYTANNNANYYAIDDVVIQGVITQYFSKSSGNLDVLGTWGTNTDGSGIAPLNFTSNNIFYNIVNNSAPTIGSAWAVSGTGSKVITGNGAFATNFTIPAGSAFTGTIDVTNTATLTIANTTVPTFGTLATGSTVNYAAAGAQTMNSTTYSNLTISGSGAKSYNNNITVNGILNISAGTLALRQNAFINFFLNGTVTGSGTMTGSASSKLTIGGTGAVGTLLFTAGSQSLHTLSMNRTSSGSITLGSNLFVANNFSHSNGILYLNGNLLKINNQITFPASSANGSLSGSKTSSLTISNAGAISGSLYMDATNSTTRAMGDVTLNRSGATLTLGNAMEVWGSITPTVGTIATGSNLTIKSDANNKGRVGIIGASGALTGSPTVELYKAAGTTGWTNICSGGVTGNAMSNWNASFAITCPSGCPDGTGANGTAFTSVYTYSEPAFTGDASNSAHYVALGGTSTAIDPNAGYWVYLGNGYPNTTAMTIPLTGGVQTGNLSNISLSLTGAAGAQNGWNLVANPYPSPIQVSNLINANTDATVYVYDPDTDSSVPYSAGGTIPMGQAFAVRALNGSAALMPVETWKTTSASNQGILRSTTTGNAYYFDDFLLNLTSTAVTKHFFTQAYFTFDNTATTGFDNGKDAYFLDGSSDPGTPKMVSITNNDKYIRNAQPLNGTVNIPVAVYTGTAGAFTITPDHLSKLPAGACVSLYDIANNITHDLRTGPYTTTISANATAPQFELRVTLTPASLTSTVNDPACNNMANGSIIAKGTSAGPWNYTWKDNAGNIIKTKNNSGGADTLKNVSAGTFKVDVNTVGTCDNANASFNLAASVLLPTAAFTVNRDSLIINGTNQFVFTNNSTNAISYKWLFGDGHSATTPTVSYMYTTPGDYTVKLTANSACGDSSAFSYQVHALSSSVTGIASVGSSDNNIKIGRDANGIYVQLNYDKNTRAVVSISDILGREIIPATPVEGMKDRFYFEIAAREQVLLITVTTSEKRVTQRIIN